VNPPPAIRRPRRRDARETRAALVIVACLAALLPLTAAGVYLCYPSRIGPAQPISFSHRVHAGDKRISCLFCQRAPSTRPRRRAGLQTCMLCHERSSSPIGDRQAPPHWDASDPSRGFASTTCRDFVFFNHSLHVRKGATAAAATGDVRRHGPRRHALGPEHGLLRAMHRDNNVSHDCLICHR